MEKPILLDLSITIREMFGYIKLLIILTEIKLLFFSHINLLRRKTYLSKCSLSFPIIPKVK